MKITIEFKKEDCWIGAFWRKDSAYGIRHLFVCLIPCFPLHITWDYYPSAPHWHHWDDGAYYSHSHKKASRPHGHHGSRYGLPNKDEQLRQFNQREAKKNLKIL